MRPVLFSCEMPTPYSGELMFKPITALLLFAASLSAAQAHPHGRHQTPAKSQTGIVLETTPIHLFGVRKGTDAERASSILNVEAVPLSKDDRRLSGLKDLLKSWAASPSKTLPPREEVGVYSLQEANPFSLNSTYEDIGLILIKTSDGILKFATAQNSMRPLSSLEWTNAEVEGTAWMLPATDAIWKLTPRKDGFQPASTQAFAFSRAAFVNIDKAMAVSSFLPLSVDGIICLATDSQGQYRGLFKFPAWKTVIPLVGVQIGNSIFLQATLPCSLTAIYQLDERPGQLENVGRHPGLYDLGPNDSILRIKFTDNAVQLSLRVTPRAYRNGFDWMKDLHDQSPISLEIDRAKLVALPELQASYLTHFDRKMWVMSDEDDSFMHEADLAYKSANLPFAVPSLYEGDLTIDAHAQHAQAIGRDLAATVKSLGLKVTTMPLPIAN